MPESNENFPERPLTPHPSYHCFFTGRAAMAFRHHYVTGIIHDPANMIAMSDEMRTLELGGLQDFLRTTFVYGDRSDASISKDNVVTKYSRSRKESITAIATPRPLTARELFEQEVKREENYLLEVYLDTESFKDPAMIQSLVLRGVIRAMLNLPRLTPPQPSARWRGVVRAMLNLSRLTPPQPSARWRGVLTRKRGKHRQDPSLAEEEGQVNYFMSRYPEAIHLELAPNLDFQPQELPPEKQEEWRKYYAGEGPKPIDDEEESEKPPET